MGCLTFLIRLLIAAVFFVTTVALDAAVCYMGVNFVTQGNSDLALRLTLFCALLSVPMALMAVKNYLVEGGIKLLLGVVAFSLLIALGGLVVACVIAVIIYYISAMLGTVATVVLVAMLAFFILAMI